MKKKTKTDWRRIWKNNAYMLSMICHACPGILVVTLLMAALGALTGFLLNTYIFMYALNALQEGTALKEVLVTITVMFIYTVLYMVFQCWANRYIELRSPRVHVYIQGMLQKKAVLSSLMRVNL